MNGFQQDLLLDLFESVIAVNVAHLEYGDSRYSDGRVRNEHTRRAVQESAKAGCQKAVREMCDAYNRAKGEHVPEDYLDACVEKHLTKGITIAHGELVA